MIAFQIKTLPDLLTCLRIKARGPVSPEMNIDAAFLDVWCWRPVTVRSMRELRFVDLKKFQVVDDFARIEVDADR